jgi:hypothetical protein
MHASIQRYAGDPDALLAAYDALLADFPSGSFWAQLCLRADDGIVVVDTCPSREAYETFMAGPEFKAARARHGLPDPAAEDYPVHAGILRGVLEYPR